MRMKTLNAVRVAARVIGRVLEAQLPVGAAAGLRTR